MKYPVIKIERYATFRECFISFLGVDESELKNTYWVGSNGEKDYEVNAVEVLNTPTKWCDDCWGWTNFKKQIIHIWIGDAAKIEDVIGLIAHETAHLKRPKHRIAKMEERKAEEVRTIAQFAYYTARNLFNQ